MREAGVAKEGVGLARGCMQCPVAHHLTPPALFCSENTSRDVTSVLKSGENLIFFNFLALELNFAGVAIT